MRAQASASTLSNRHWPALALAALAAAIALLPAPLHAAAAAATDEAVDCKLPPQIHSLGRNVTYLAAGRLVHIPVSECKLRGGSWNGRGPGAYAGASGPLAVTVGGDPGAPACPLQATVAGLRAGNSLAVRAGPGTSFARVGRLGNRDRVYLCDRSGNAGWVGIVFARDGALDCGLSNPIAQARPYSGPCASGWVRSNYLR